MKHLYDDADKNKYEAYTKAEVLEVIQEAISSGELPEEINGLVLTFKNPVDNLGYKIAFCTQAKYNELKAADQLVANCLYYITDDSSYQDLLNAIKNISDEVESLESNIAEQVNTKRVNIYNGDGYIEGDNEGYVEIKGENDLILKGGSNTINVSDLILYKHTVYMKVGQAYCYFVIYNNSATEFDRSNFKDVINGYDVGMKVSGRYVDSANSKVYPLIDAGYLNDKYQARYFDASNESQVVSANPSSTTISDTITRLI